MKELLLPIGALALCWLAIYLRLRFVDRGLDLPNHRSLHERPTPHGGGLGIVAALVVSGVLLDIPTAQVVAVFALSLLSLVDDVRHLPFWLRLSAHLAAAAVLCGLIGIADWRLWPPAVLAIAWMTNLFNFMDGADGLAGSQGLVGFSAYAVGFGLAGDPALAAWCAAAALACLGFLCFNWPPAKIFMGDVGSIPLGFLAGGLGVLGLWRDVWPVWFPLMVFSLFILDASVTLARRVLAGQRVWEAHRDHYYQRMVRLGYGHRGMTLRWSGLMGFGALLAIGLLGAPLWLQWTGAVAWCLVLMVLGHRLDRHWRSANPRAGQVS